MDDTDHRPESDNLVMNNATAIEHTAALPQLRRFGEIGMWHDFPFAFWMTCNEQRNRSSNEYKPVWRTLKLHAKCSAFFPTDEPITPLDENSYVFDLEQSSYTSKSLGGSAVFVDGYNDEVSEQKQIDPSAFGDNIDDGTSDVESIDTAKNESPPTSSVFKEVITSRSFMHMMTVATLTFRPSVGSKFDCNGKDRSACW